MQRTTVQPAQAGRTAAAFACPSAPPFRPLPEAPVPLTPPVRSTTALLFVCPCVWTTRSLVAMPGRPSTFSSRVPFSWAVPSPPTRRAIRKLATALVRQLPVQPSFAMATMSTRQVHVSRLPTGAPGFAAAVRPRATQPPSATRTRATSLVRLPSVPLSTVPTTRRLSKATAPSASPHQLTRLHRASARTCAPCASRSIRCRLPTSTTRPALT
mmetsp:Transcript_2370/g.7565  ORF Transcript_2370/g.7565 Transcript_2370/m.7565 type:complete len:213 (-) Transcript_2370:26-664(-)